MALLLRISIILGFFGLYLLKIFIRPKRNLPPFPPGPKQKPIIGNLEDLPPPGKPDWIHWLHHKDLYGPISSITTFGNTLIILNDVQIAIDLMEKRAATHSSRPRIVFAGEMVGYSDLLPFMPYDDKFRTHRKSIVRAIGTNTVLSDFLPFQDIESRRFLLHVLEKPEDLLQHVRTGVGAVILKAAYGYNIKRDGKDPLVNLIEKALWEVGQASVPGTWLVDILPFLKHLPDWLPGTRFKRVAKQWRKTRDEFAEKPYAFVKRQAAHGIREVSYVLKAFAGGKMSPEQEYVIKWTASTLYAGGSDTRKAHEEIDRVVGNDRLPNFDDQEKLPYIDAIVKESLRWHPALPMAFPHMTTEDDIYNGYLIPKGAMLLPNVWAFCHDPKTYHEPATFKPERFLSINGQTPERDPQSISFGFGRRICPGRLFAYSAIYIVIVQFLAVFDISKPVENGSEIDPTVDFEPGIISHPVPFKACVKPRSSKHEALIRAVEKEHPLPKESHAKIYESIY